MLTYAHSLLRGILACNEEASREIGGYPTMNAYALAPKLSMPVLCDDSRHRRREW